MRYSKTGLQLTEGFESCRLVAYQDVRGIWTIGWGHTGPEVVEGLVWTQEQADAQLEKDMAYAECRVNGLLAVPVTQGEFDALVDFALNVGCNAFAGSTMLKLLNEGNYAGAAEEFEKWDHAAGKVVAGLLRRREEEKNEFNQAG